MSLYCIYNARIVWLFLDRHRRHRRNDSHRHLYVYLPNEVSQNRPFLGLSDRGAGYCWGEPVVFDGVATPDNATTKRRHTIFFASRPEPDAWLCE